MLVLLLLASCTSSQQLSVGEQAICVRRHGDDGLTLRLAARVREQLQGDGAFSLECSADSPTMLNVFQVKDWEEVGTRVRMIANLELELVDGTKTTMVTTCGEDRVRVCVNDVVAWVHRELQGVAVTPGETESLACLPLPEVLDSDRSLAEFVDVLGAGVVFTQDDYGEKRLLQIRHEVNVCLYGETKADVFVDFDRSSYGVNWILVSPDEPWDARAVSAVLGQPTEKVPCVLKDLPGGLESIYVRAKGKAEQYHDVKWVYGRENVIVDVVGDQVFGVRWVESPDLNSEKCP